MFHSRSVGFHQYKNQLTHADLYLDTFNYNAGATASNVLWAGVPLITKAGVGYTARMASSLLKSIELPELITSTSDEYERLALSLAKDPEEARCYPLKTYSKTYYFRTFRYG